MKAHGLFTDKSLETLQDKEQCAVLFRHNSLNGILLRVNPNQPDDEQRKDTNGNTRYYSEKYMIAENGYFVSSEWGPDRTDAKKPLIDWIFALMQEIKFSTGIPMPILSVHISLCPARTAMTRMPLLIPMYPAHSCVPM